MSPEQIRHEVLDARSDVFSASVVLWELLTCRRLFRRESEFVTMRAVCNDSAAAPSTINPQVPGELDAIVHRGLAKSREERFSSAESMRLALEEVIWREQWRADASSLRALLTALFPGAERVDDETDHPGAPAQAGEPSSFDEEPTERELTPLDHPSPPLHTPAPARQCPPLSQEEEPTRVMPVPMSIGEPPFARAPLPPWPPPALACRSSGRMRVVLLATLLGLILAAVVLRSIG
jgi:serine/threonine-protein kinase